MAAALPAAPDTGGCDAVAGTLGRMAKRVNRRGGATMLAPRNRCKTGHYKSQLTMIPTLADSMAKGGYGMQIVDESELDPQTCVSTR